MLGTQVPYRKHVVLLDSAGQCLGLFIFYPGKRTIKKKVCKAIREDLDNYEAVIEWVSPVLVYKAGELKFEVRIFDDNEDDNPTNYVYYLKEIKLF